MDAAILRLTDTVICNNIKKAFKQARQKFQDSKEQIDMQEVIANLSEDPLRCALLDHHSPFERDVKMSMKLSLGFYFILLPLVVLSGLAYIFHIPISFVFLLIFIEAIFLSQRVEVLVRRYIKLHNLSYR